MLQDGQPREVGVNGFKTHQPRANHTLWDMWKPSWCCFPGESRMTLVKWTCCLQACTSAVWDCPNSGMIRDTCMMPWRMGFECLFWAWASVSVSAASNSWAKAEKASNARLQPLRLPKISDQRRHCDIEDTQRRIPDSSPGAKVVQLGELSICTLHARQHEGTARQVHPWGNAASGCGGPRPHNAGAQCPHLPRRLVSHDASDGAMSQKTTQAALTCWTVLVTCGPANGVGHVDGNGDCPVLKKSSVRFANPSSPSSPMSGCRCPRCPENSAESLRKSNFGTEIVTSAAPYRFVRIGLWGLEWPEAMLEHVGEQP